MASHRQFTKNWWNHERVHFRLYSSIAVRAEISKGDATASAKRLKVMAGIPELEILPGIQPLAESIVQLLQLPPKAALDATHLAFAITHWMDYLLTCNCTSESREIHAPSSHYVDMPPVIHPKLTDYRSK